MTPPIRSTVSRLAALLLLAGMVALPLGCRAFMIGSEAVWMTGTAIVDPWDKSENFWDDYTDYLDSSARAMRRNMESLHRQIDRHLMLHDWDDPSN